MAEDWHYSLYTQALPIHNWIEEIDHNQISESFTSSAGETLNRVSYAIHNDPEMVSPEILSHSFVRFGAVLLLTILVRYRNA